MLGYIISAILLFICYSTTFSQCLIEGPRNANSYSNNNTAGTINWSNPGNINSSDNNRATAGSTVGILSTATTNYLVATNFGFTIPLTANICGIEIDIEKRAQGLVIGSSINDNLVRIVKNGVITGTSLNLGTNFTSSDNYLAHGNNSEAWGTTWTPSDINNSNFGIAYSANLNAGLASIFLSAEIDHIQISVYYEIPLPIKLNSFNANRTNKIVQLNWETDSEINCDYFSIERSIDGINWEVREKINGAGNSSTILNYFFNDENDLNKATYYRLKQTDFDGSFEHSDILPVKPYQNTNITIYPNPSYGELNIKSDDKIVKIELINLLGEIVKTFNFNNQNIKIDLNNYPKNIFFIKTYTSSHIDIQKIILNTN